MARKRAATGVPASQRTQRPFRESSYELEIWNKNRAFMQSRLSVWKQRAASLGDDKGDDTGDFCDTQPTRRHSHSSATREAPPKSPERLFADALTQELNTLLRHKEAPARQHALCGRSVSLERPPARHGWCWEDFAYGSGLGAVLVVLWRQLAGLAFAPRVAMVIAAFVFMFSSAVLYTRGRMRRAASSRRRRA